MKCINTNVERKECSCILCSSNYIWHLSLKSLEYWGLNAPNQKTMVELNSVVDKLLKEKQILEDEVNGNTLSIKYATLYFADVTQATLLVYEHEMLHPKDQEDFDINKQVYKFLVQVIKEVLDVNKPR